MAVGRILVGPLSPLLRDLVCRLVGDASVIVMSALPVEALIDEAIRLRAATVVAAFDDEADAIVASRALTPLVPGAALVSIDPRGRWATRYVCGVVESESRDFSPASLRAILGSESAP